MQNPIRFKTLSDGKKVLWDVRDPYERVLVFTPQ